MDTVTTTSILQVLQYSIIQYSTVQYSTVQHIVPEHSHHHQYSRDTPVQYCQNSLLSIDAVTTTSVLRVLQYRTVKYSAVENGKVQ